MNMLSVSPATLVMGGRPRGKTKELHTQYTMVLRCASLPPLDTGEHGERSYTCEILKDDVGGRNRTKGDRHRGKLDEFEEELEKIVGLHDLKMQLRRWAKGMILDFNRRAMGINLGPRKRPHMAFLGNPGTGNKKHIITAIFQIEIDACGRMNGGLVDHMLNNARENLDSRLSLESQGDELFTITLDDLEAGLRELAQRAKFN